MTKPNQSAADYSRLSPSVAAERPLPGTKVPVGASFDRAGEYLYFMFAESGQQLELCRVDLRSGIRETVFGAQGTGVELTLEEQMRRERLRITWDGLSDYKLINHPESDLVLINSGGRFSVHDIESRRVVLDLSSQDFLSIQPMPDGLALVGVCEVGVVKVEIETGKTAVLVENDISKARTRVGVAEFVAQEELERLEGVWISQDGRWLAFTEVDESHVEPFVITHLGSRAMDSETHYYPFTGGANAEVRLGIVDTNRGEVRYLDCSALEGGYLARVCWLEDAQLVFAVLNRAQTSISWFCADPKSARITPLLLESSDTYVNLPQSVLPLGPSSVLTTVEESGFAHLAIIDSSGTVSQVTFGDWMVTEILGISRDGRHAWIVSTEASPLQRHIYRVELSGGRTTRISELDGYYVGVSSNLDDDLLFMQHSSCGASPTSKVVTGAGTAVCDIVADPIRAEALGLRPPKLFSLVIPSGEELFGALYLPEDGITAGRPLVVAVYGGPRAQVVQDHWSMTIDLQAQLLAQSGVVVVKVDNRGSYFRGKDFEVQLNRRFGTIELEDQISCVDYLVAEYGIDPDRVGVYGWSYGGFMTLSAMCKAPDRFKVGVAGAPVVDFSLYDTAYTERYMGTPEFNSESYAEANICNHLDSLRGDLLIIHGLVDENVHFRNTARLMEALLGKGKGVELLLLPESRHSPRGFSTLLEILERRTKFLLDGLGVAKDSSDAL